MSNALHSTGSVPPERPVFSHLTRDESEQLLARNHVGRIAYSFRDRVDIEPIHYVYSEQWIYGRTSPGIKVSTIAHHRWVAFEVDEVDSLFQWRSVVVHGAFYILEPNGSQRPNPMYVHAVELLRSLIPETLTGDDPASFRHIVFRIHLDEVLGRQARYTP